MYAKLLVIWFLIVLHTYLGSKELKKKSNTRLEFNIEEQLPEEVKKGSSKNPIDLDCKGDAKVTTELAFEPQIGPSSDVFKLPRPQGHRGSVQSPQRTTAAVGDDGQLIRLGNQNSTSIRQKPRKRARIASGQSTPSIHLSPRHPGQPAAQANLGAATSNDDTSGPADLRAQPPTNHQATSGEQVGVLAPWTEAPWEVIMLWNVRNQSTVQQLTAQQLTAQQSTVQQSTVQQSTAHGPRKKKKTAPIVGPSGSYQLALWLSAPKQSDEKFYCTTSSPEEFSSLLGFKTLADLMDKARALYQSDLAARRARARQSRGQPNQLTAPVCPGFRVYPKQPVLYIPATQSCQSSAPRALMNS
ncbi:hypothetical protein KEM48_000105 [Puccinia striiformis f. sp. tritici PST-130]|nr:hypothetical protein KEM48_000105 [Puccinia striiformis f. sp. tritici PST-130]